MPKLLVILGPTASGKSDLAIALARKFDGEIISADSRQVYRGMDIGTGKVTRREQRLVPHHLLDVASPKKSYTVAHFQRDAKKIITGIQRRGKLPILCGGTGFWIQSLLTGMELPTVKPNPALRKRLSKCTADELYARLRKLDPVRAREIDKRNPLRLIRALEIVMTTKKPVPPLETQSHYDALIMGLRLPENKLNHRIDLRLRTRLRHGMIAEVKNLLRNGVSKQRLIDLGLEYRFVTNYLLKKISKKELEIELADAIHAYAKRQMTWFRRMERMGMHIEWISTPKQAHDLVNKFIK